MRTPACPECGMRLAVANAAVVRRWVALLSANPSLWRGRLTHTTCLVCPACDAYALGINAEVGAPFYSDVVPAFLTVHDWDWWNADPAECDSRTWPDFGCVTFSESAVRAAVDHVQSHGRGARTPSAEDRTRLAAAAGFPARERTESTWRSALKKLQTRTGSQYVDADLEAAVALLLDVLARHPWQQTSLDQAIADDTA